MTSTSVTTRVRTPCLRLFSSISSIGPLLLVSVLWSLGSEELQPLIRLCHRKIDGGFLSGQLEDNILTRGSLTLYKVSSGEFFPRDVHCRACVKGCLPYQPLIVNSQGTAAPGAPVRARLKIPCVGAFLRLGLVR